MYDTEHRKKVIKTFVRFGCSAADAIAKLGHPTAKCPAPGGKGIGSATMSSRKGGVAGRSIPMRESRARSIATWNTVKASLGR